MSQTEGVIAIKAAWDGSKMIELCYIWLIFALRGRRHVHNNNKRKEMQMKTKEGVDVKTFTLQLPPFLSI